MPSTHERLLADALAPLSRRRFFLGAAAGLGTTVAACTSGSATGLPADLQTLTPGEYRLFQRLAAVFLPTTAVGLTPVEKVPLFRNIDHMLGLLPEPLRNDLGLGLKLFDYGSYVIGWHFSPFHRLDDASAETYCRAWQDGNEIQRGLFQALRQIVYMSYWREPDTWAPIDYDGPVTAKWGIPRLGNAPLPAE